MKGLILKIEELTNKINRLEIENESLKQELNFYKENNKIRNKFKIDATGLESILEAIPSAVVIIDAKEEKFIYLNERAKELYGVNCVGHDIESHLIKLKPLKLDGTPCPNEEIPAIYSLKHGKEIRNKNIILERPDGSKVSVLVNAAPIFDEKKETVNSVIGFFEDITNFINVKNSLSDSEEKLSFQAKILSHINDAIIALDENEKITYFNKAFLNLFGCQEHELIGHKFFDIIQCYIDEESKEKMLWTLEERHKVYSKKDEDHLDKIICYSKEGTQIILDANKTVVRNSKGELKGFILSIRDISERYKYEHELKKSEERYRYLYNSIDEGFAIVEVIFDKENKPVDFRYVELNPAYEKVTGIKNKDVLGKTAKELKFDFEDFWYETYGKVDLTGESVRFIHEEKSLNMWVDAYVLKST